MIDFSEIDDIGWTKFVENHPESNIFHHRDWSRVIAQTYGYEPFAVVLREPDNSIAAGLPMMKIRSWMTGKRWVSLPFTDQCGPLLRNKDDLEVFINELIRKNKESNSPGIEIRSGLPSTDGIVYSNRHYIHYLKFDKGPEELYKKFRKKGVRYCIKKAIKAGIDISLSSESDALMDFYDLHLMTRRKLGVPTQPKKYFLNLWENLIKREMGFTALAQYEGKPIAGGVFLHYNKNLIYKYGATDPEYMNLYANHLLLWEVIQWGCKNEMAVMDWGRTDKDKEGLRKFKLGWGTEEKELTYSFIGNQPNEYSTGWKQKIIEGIVGKSPVWVGRLIGELLYKHVG